MPQATFAATANVGTDTAIDLSSQLDEPMDTRGGVDPIRAAQEQQVSTAGAVDLTSTGQGATSDAGSGEIVVLDDHTVALGHQLEAGAELHISYDTRGTSQVL